MLIRKPCHKAFWLLQAHTMSLIANCDWPDECPELLSSLISLLSSNSPNHVHGAMQVFTEFIKSDLTEDQILPILRQLLPVLLAVLGSTEVSLLPLSAYSFSCNPSQHTDLTRSRSVSVFHQCVMSLYMVKDIHPQAVKEATASIFAVWLAAFRTLLNTDPLADVSRPYWDGIAIRIQIFKVP
jgi:importin-9